MNNATNNRGYSADAIASIVGIAVYEKWQTAY